MTKLTRLFEPGTIGKMELKNRLVMAPLGGFADLEGNMPDRMIPYYEARAKGGVGLIICMSSTVLYKARAPGRLGAYDDKFIPGLRELSSIIHKHGVKAGLEINHHGRGLSQWRTYYEHPEEIDVVGPSAIPWVWNEIAPREATKEDIDEIARAFAQAAYRVKEAGFDVVEILGGHGYLIGQFFSPMTNIRTDEYGGSVKNRARFACEIISRVKEKVGADFPVIFRVGGSEFLSGGFTIEDTVQQAPLFVEAGADAIDVTAGSYESNHWTTPSYLFPPGPLVPLAEAIKKAVKVPVIAVGKIGDPVFAEQILQEDKADFIAMGRPLLADPELPNKAKEGRFEDICRCIYCNNCFDLRWRPRLEKAGYLSLSCTVNPTVLREKESVIKPTQVSKTVMVIGGGPAGMEVAAVLAERGHSVTLYEKEDKLGGQWNIASQQEKRREVYPYLTQHLSRKLTQAQVNIVPNTEVTAELVNQLKPDVAIVAIGATPKTLDVPGADGENVVQAVDVITGKCKVGDRVAVIGGRYIGMEVALSLAEQGKRVSLITARELGRNKRFIERNIKLALRDKLMEKDVCIYTNSPVRQITSDGVHFANSRELAFIRVDTVVLAVGYKPESKLVEELKGIVPEVYAIGDCVEPRDVMEAIGEAYEIAQQI